MERTERMSAAVQRPGPQTVVHSPIVEKSLVIRCTVRRIWLFIMQATSMQRQTTELKHTRRCTLRCSASDSCCLFFACSFYQSSNSKCEYSVHEGDGDSCCHAKNEPSHFYASCSLVVYTTLTCFRLNKSHSPSPRSFRERGAHYKEEDSCNIYPHHAWRAIYWFVVT